MTPRLRIIAVNDVYALDNLPRLCSLVRHHASVDPAELFLVTMAGDFLAPSILSSLDAGRGMVDCLNAVPITHAILGNHEDDLEVKDLCARLHELRGTVLMTNVRGLDDSFPTHQILHVGGVKIGIIGVCDGDPTLYRRTPFGGARVDPANDSARRAAAFLHAEGCAWVIAITHQRAADDRALATTTPPFPLILGGHEHDALIQVIGATTLVKAPAEASAAVIVEILCSDPPEVSVRLEPVAGYPEDEAMRARVDGHLARVREVESATLMLLPPGTLLSSVGTRSRQTSMGTLVCSRLRDALDAEATLFNGGGIRGARDYTTRVTYGDLKSEVPFDNEIVVARLPGHVVQDAVRASRALSPAESGGFLQVDDRIKVDSSNAILELNGAPFDPQRIYRIALVRNLFEGMDRIEPLVRFAAEHPAWVPERMSGRDVKVVLLSAFCAVLWEQLGGFDAIDANHDGMVTAQELVDAITRATQQPPSELAARVVLDVLDRDHDRAINRGEGHVPKKP